MSEAQPIGIRLDNKFLNKLDKLSKEEHLDRSTTMRILLEEGYKNHLKKKAAEEYKSGLITISKAAEKAELTVWKMEQYLINHGFKSEYSVEDLKQETELLLKKLKER